MRKFIGTIVILLVVFAGVGMYRGWFEVSRSGEGEESHVELKINKEKFKEDTAKFKDRVDDRLNQDDEEEEKKPGLLNR